MSNYRHLSSGKWLHRDGAQRCVDLSRLRHRDAELLEGSHELLLLLVAQITELEVAGLQLLLKDLQDRLVLRRRVDGLLWRRLRLAARRDLADGLSTSQVDHVVFVAASVARHLLVRRIPPLSIDAELVFVP